MNRAEKAVKDSALLSHCNTDWRLVWGETKPWVPKHTQVLNDRGYERLNRSRCSGWNQKLCRSGIKHIIQWGSSTAHKPRPMLLYHRRGYFPNILKRFKHCQPHEPNELHALSVSAQPSEAIVFKRTTEAQQQHLARKETRVGACEHCHNFQIRSTKTREPFTMISCL